MRCAPSTHGDKESACAHNSTNGEVIRNDGTCCISDNSVPNYLRLRYPSHHSTTDFRYLDGVWENDQFDSCFWVLFSDVCCNDDIFQQTCPTLSFSSCFGHFFLPICLQYTRLKYVRRKTHKKYLSCFKKLQHHQYGQFRTMSRSSRDSPQRRMSTLGYDAPRLYCELKK